MPIDSAALDTLRRAIGVEVGPISYPIEEGHIQRFAEAIGDLNPAYFDPEAVKTLPAGGIIAPPTFLRCCLPPLLPMNIADVTGLRKVLEGGSEWQFYEFVRPGDRISVTMKLAGLRERQGRLGVMLITSTEVTYRNQHGLTAATQVIHRIHY